MGSAEDATPAGSETRERPGYRKLKDLRGLFGLSQNGIRLYERAGIISLPRNSQNNYRSAPLADAVRMCDAFDLARYGIRLKDAGELVSTSGTDEEVARLRAFSDELDRQIMELIDKKSSLERRTYHLARYERNPLACEVTSDADLWFVHLHDQDVTIGDAYDDAVAWWRFAPFVSAGLVVSLDERGDATDAQHGPTATGAAVSRFGLPTEKATHFCVAGRRYLSGFVTFPVEELPGHATYAHLFDYARERGIPLDAGRVLHRLLRCHDEGDVPMRVDLVYIPVRETCS